MNGVHVTPTSASRAEAAFYMVRQLECWKNAPRILGFVNEYGGIEKTGDDCYKINCERLKTIFATGVGVIEGVRCRNSTRVL
jgi:hypothetical protein